MSVGQIVIKLHAICIETSWLSAYAHITCIPIKLQLINGANLIELVVVDYSNKSPQSGAIQTAQFEYKLK